MITVRNGESEAVFITEHRRWTSENTTLEEVLNSEVPDDVHLCYAEFLHEDGIEGLVLDSIKYLGLKVLSVTKVITDRTLVV